ncbi:MAG TPA: DUF5715 family protein [Blastocatellia bacterium]|nr:DUF5715 family protein [Blastocatellia bacterium]
MVSTAVVLTTILCPSCKNRRLTSHAPFIETVDPWKEAVDKVEQDRGEAEGREARVEVPEELKQYRDRRRFLAVQAADSRAQVGTISQDLVDVVSLIRQGELVAMKPLGADYILYGVGLNVSGEPFEHYDPATRQNIPLIATEEELREEVRQAADASKESAANLASVQAQLRRVPKRDRARRKGLSIKVSQATKELASATARSKALATFYADPKRRAALLAEYQALSEFARDFEGETYNLNDSESRRRFKAKLLSYIRPEARDVILQLAHDYKRKFGRPLPISSLVRPVQYQHKLAESNANAARGPTPPHSSGLAFDLYYKFMSAAEQEYLMSMIARLKDDGRVEALRELRDNIHVYVFGNGRPPDRKLVARVIASESPSKPEKRRRRSRRRAHFVARRAK